MSKPTILNFGKIAEISTKLTIPELEACYPGMNPSEFNVIIAPGVMPKTVGKQGLILLAEDTQEQLGLAVQVGRIVAKSPLAFNYADWGGHTPPQDGDIIWIARYAGAVFEGCDGREYRLVKDKDVIGVIPPIDEIKLALAKSLSEEVPAKVA